MRRQLERVIENAPIQIAPSSLMASVCPVTAATEALATESEGDARGAIFTRAEVVDFILDLAGYTEDQPLHEKRLLEPSFGGGDFLLPIIKSLTEKDS